MRVLKAFVLLVGVLSAASAMAQGKKSPGNNVDLSQLPDCPDTAQVIAAEILCRCDAGQADGSVWGSGPYTADSDICTAATHAGIVGTNGGGVRVLLQPGQASYDGSTAHGITSKDWGSFQASFSVSHLNGSVETTYPTCAEMPDGAHSFSCRCVPDFTIRGVWGSGPYTADSDICSAALHAGYIDETGGDVFVLRVQGLRFYHGQDSYGVSSSDWGAFDPSIVFNWN